MLVLAYSRFPILKWEMTTNPPDEYPGNAPLDVGKYVGELEEQLRRVFR